jgi:PPOX class probable F420-dependent enzyme
MTDTTTDAKAVYRAHPTQDEIDEVLGQRTIATVGTLNEDGSIHLAYVIFLFEDGRLYFETSSVTRKARNAGARPQASFIVDGRASTGRKLMVAAEGTARVIVGPEAAAINHRLRERYIVPDAIGAIDRAWGRLDDVTVEITPARWRSWTNAVLKAESEKELGGSYSAAFRPD